MPEYKTYDTLKGVLPHDDVLQQCIHCGMCLATCPTYDLTGLERSSPRGRIKMIKSVAQGKLPITDVFADEMDFCLDCQACETACPAGVQYGKMVEAARVEVTKSKVEPWLKRNLRRWGLNHIIGKPALLKLTARFLYFYQNSGLQKLVHATGVLRLLGKNVPEMDKLTPRMSRHFSSSLIKEVTPPKTEKKHRVAFLTGCLMDVAFADINMDTIEVLVRNGCEIITPRNQVCCGSLHEHFGEMDKAKELARKNLELFSKYNYDYLVANSAGCGAFMKEYAHVFENDPALAEKAKTFSSKILDLTEFLAQTGLEKDMTPVGKPVTYHDACHLCHTQKITKEPRDILAQIPDIDLRPLDESMWCCGSAGIYNVVRYDDSMKMLEKKMKNIGRTGSEIVVTGNPGCMVQIAYGSKKYNVPVETVHPATILRRAYDGKE